MRNDRHHVQMLMMQQVEAAEREQHGAEERRRLAELKPPQEPERASERRHVIGDQLQIESGPKRKNAIDQLMKRMEHADLTFAVQVVSGEDGRRPQDAITRVERLLIEMPRRQMKPGQVVEHEDPAGEQRENERCEQSCAADPNQDG